MNFAVKKNTKYGTKNRIYLWIENNVAELCKNFETFCFMAFKF